MKKQKPNFNNAEGPDVKPLTKNQKKKMKQRKKQLATVSAKEENETKENEATTSQLIKGAISNTPLSVPPNPTIDAQVANRQEKKKLKKLRQKEKKLAANGAKVSENECNATRNGFSRNGDGSLLAKSTGTIPKEKPKDCVDIHKSTQISLSKSQKRKLKRLIKKEKEANSSESQNQKTSAVKMPTNKKDKTNGKSKSLNLKTNVIRRQTQQEICSEVKKGMESSFIPSPKQPKTFAMHKPPRKSTLLKPLVFDVAPIETLIWAGEFQELVRSKLLCDSQTTPFYEIGRHFGMRSTRTDDIVIKELFVKFLEEKKAGHFTYTPDKELRVLLVLKRPSTLPCCEVENLKIALQQLGVPVLRVEVFKPMWNPDHSYGRYLVEVSRGADLEALYKNTKLLGHENWKWSKLKKPSISQCRNCQRYGHVASNCRMPFRCVKCKDPHEPSKCPRTWIKDGVENVYCHNCKKNGHPSNYRGCPAYKQRCEALERQRANSHFSTLLNKVVHSVNKALEKDKTPISPRN